MTTEKEANGTGAMPPESGPILVPWRLAVGNFVSVAWQNWQGRARETIGQVLEVRTETVIIRPKNRKKADDTEEVHLSRILGVEVIKEGDDAVEVRRQAWLLIKRAASRINSRNTWDRDGLFHDLRKIQDIFPELKEK